MTTIPSYGLKLSIQHVLCILCLDCLGATASIQRFGFSRVSTDTTIEDSSSGVRGGTSQHPKMSSSTRSFWQMREETDILQMEIQYPGRHPHERHLQSVVERNLGEKDRYGMDPIEHEAASQYQEDSDQDPSALRSQAQLVFDDDFGRAVLPYDPIIFTEQTTHNYKPIRIHYITTPIEKRRGESAFLDQQIDEFLTIGLPQAAEIWSHHLSVYPTLGPIKVSRGVCFGSFQEDIDPVEVYDADLVIIVSAWEELDTIPVCGPHSLALGAACALDQWDRPIVGFVNLCLQSQPETKEYELDDLVTQAFQTANGIQPTKLRNGTAMEEHKRVDPTTILVHELAHTMAFDSYLFKFFRNGTTGEPLTPRPFAEVTVQCTNSDVPSLIRGFPSEKVLRNGVNYDGNPYFNIVTPRVAQVARNLFDCQTMAGARLEDFEGTCIGSHWDERLFLQDILSPALAWRNNFLSPLTLALLEDSGWYSVNYHNVTVPSFGLGAGCEFVEKPCIVEDKVPHYATGYGFCDTPIRVKEQEGNSFEVEEETWMKVTCDPNHQYFASCDLFDVATIPDFLNVRFPAGKGLFRDDNLKSKFPQADHCPISMDFLGVDCTREESLFDNYHHGSRRHMYIGEEVGPSSRCINAFSDISPERNRRIDFPACMKLECDANLHKVVLGSGEFQRVCEYDGQVLTIPSTDGADFLICPRLATVCPHLFCPAGCSGRGVCDYEAQPHPHCKCFDPENTSDGCYEGDSEELSSSPTTSNLDGEVSNTNGSDYVNNFAASTLSSSAPGQNCILISWTFAFVFSIAIALFIL
jgi:Leishmanolysin